MSEKKLNSPQVPNDPIFKLAADALLGLDMHLQGRDRFGDVKGLADVIRNTLDEKMPIHKATLTIMLWEATLKYLNLKPEQLRTKEKLIPRLEDIYKKLYSYQNQPCEEIVKLRDFCLYLFNLDMYGRDDVVPQRPYNPYRKDLVHA